MNKITQLVEFAKIRDMGKLTLMQNEQEQLECGMLIIEVQNGLDYSRVNDGKCLFQYRDPQMVKKLIAAVVAQFNANINVTTERMSAVAIYETAVMLSEYTHERLEDIILMLKNAKMGVYGKIYNRIDVAVIMEWWKLYLEDKANWAEVEYRSQKGADYRTEVDTQIRQKEILMENMREKLAREKAADRAARNMKAAEFVR